MIQLDTIRVFNQDRRGMREIDRYLKAKGLRVTHDQKIIARNFRVVGHVQSWTDGTQRIVKGAKCPA